MKPDEIYRKYYHLAFFESKKLTLKGQFITSVSEDLYQQFISYKNILETANNNLTISVNELENDEYLISIIMPAFNDQDTISESIESIIDQSYTNWELIIVDDGSTDNTKLVVEQFIKKDKRIKYIFQNNTGVAGARNTGIKQAKGNFIKLCDSDDILMPYGLEMLIRSIPFTSETTAIFYDDMAEYYQNMNHYVIKNMDQPMPKPDLYIQQLKGNIFPVGSVLIRKNVFNEIGYFDESLNGTDDFDLWNRIIQKYNVYKINLAPVYIQINHSEQLSKDIETLRCFTDITILKFMDSVGFENILDTKNTEQFSKKADDLINSVLERYDTPYESAIRLIEYVQQIEFKPERENLIEKAINENNQKFVDNFTEYLNNPKKKLLTGSQIIEEYNKSFTKHKKLNKVLLKLNNQVISDLHQYSDFFVEYKEEFLILYSSCQKIVLPEQIVEVINKNIDQIWIDSEETKNNYINSGILENRVKFIKPLSNENEFINILEQLPNNPVKSINNLESQLLKETEKITKEQKYRKLSISYQLYQTDKKNNIYKTNLAKAYITTQQYNKAAEILSECIKTGFVNKEVLLDMALCLENMGDMKTALAIKKKADSIQ